MAENSAKKNIGLSVPQRFTNAVVAAYSDVAKGVEVTPKQLALISNYYIKLDEMFKKPDVGIKWNQVNMSELAMTVAHASRLNLDMQLDHISFMPFKNSKTGMYSLVAVKSWKGYEYISKTFGLDPPERLIVELVYSNDEFAITKKDAMHECDSYIFNIKNPFNRGKIVGGFAYLEYADKSKNRILTMSEEEILKYRPQRYSQNFWSGENAKKMYEKTIAKQILKKVALDPDKVNKFQDSFNKLEAEEINFSANMAQEEIEENMGKGEFVDVEYQDVSPDDSENDNVENPVENVENSEVMENTSLFEGEPL